MKNYPFKMFRHVLQALARSLPGTMVVALCGLALPGHAMVLVDDTWADGSRNEQDLPTESAWFASNASLLTNAAGGGSMTGLVLPTNAVVWMTYFAPPETPSTLNVGDTLKATMVFTPDNVATGTPPTVRGLRIGLYNYAAGGTRMAGDTFSASDANGQNVQGYMLEVNFVQSFTATPLRINKRTGTASTNLMGTLGDYTLLGSGGGSSGNPGFTNGTQYTLEFSATRTAADTVVISNRLFGLNLDISCTVTDSSATTCAFDCFALRPARADSSAGIFTFTDLKVEKTSSLPVQIQPGQGVDFYQVDFVYGTELVVSNSDTGQILVDPAAVLTNSSSTSGFLNVGTIEGWVVYNMPIRPDFPYPSIRTAFKLPTPPGVPLTELDAIVLITEEPLTNFNGGTFNSWSVSKTTYNAGGVTCASCGTIVPPSIVTSSNSNFQFTNTTSACQPSHPNVQAAKGQCWECAVANSLQWLENLYGIVVPDDDVPGIGKNGGAFPTNSLPGWLDVDMFRQPNNRGDGPDTMDTHALVGKLSYMANHGLGGLIMQHQAIQNDPAMKNIAANGLTSTWQGPPTFDFILTNVLNGADVELAYDCYDDCEEPGTGHATGHAVDVVAVGYITPDQPYIMYVSDTLQTDQDHQDNQGTTNVDYSLVTGPDVCGHYHLANEPCSNTNGPIITVLVSEMPSPGMLNTEYGHLPGGRLFLNNTNTFGGDRASDFNWSRPGGWPAVADDFRPDGRPIAAVRWWGSYLNSHNPGDEDAFLLSFYTDSPADVFATNNFSYPSNLCATYIAPLDKIKVTNTFLTGLDGKIIYEYSVALHDTCLYFSHSRTNSLATPEPWAFLMEKNNFWLFRGYNIYWLVIDAERGQTFAITNGTWTNYPSGKADLTEDFWGWHTSPCSNLDASVTGKVNNRRVDGREWAMNTNFFGEVDQAFELMTYAPPPQNLQLDNASVLWAQWADRTCEGVAVLTTDGSGSRIVADDFYANSNASISCIFIWGAWRNDQYDPKAQFRLRIYSDVAATTNQPSHPGTKLWEKTFSPPPTNYASTLLYWSAGAVAFNLCESFWDPSQSAGRGGAGKDSKLYQYRFCMDTNNQFVQTNGRTYWLSVTAIGTTNQFGWKTTITNDHHLDDAVFATQTNPPASGWTNLDYPTNHPFAGHTMDMAFTLTTPLVVNASCSMCGITIARSNSQPETVALSGSSMWLVDVGPGGEASDTDTNNLDDVSAEIVQLALSGTSSLGPVTVWLRDPNQSPYLPSSGRIEECGNYVSNHLDVPPFASYGCAHSFFDIYLEVQIGTNVLHSAVPVHLNATNSAVTPSIGEVYSSPTYVIPLLDENDNPSDYSLEGLAYIPVTIPPPVITGVSVISPGFLEITWENGGRLQASPRLDGPSWTTITTNSPYIGPITGAMQFYRVYPP